MARRTPTCTGAAAGAATRHSSRRARHRTSRAPPHPVPSGRDPPHPVPSATPRPVPRRCADDLLKDPPATRETSCTRPSPVTTLSSGEWGTRLTERFSRRCVPWFQTINTTAERMARVISQQLIKIVAINKIKMFTISELWNQIRKRHNLISAASLNSSIRTQSTCNTCTGLD